MLQIPPSSPSGASPSEPGRAGGWLPLAALLLPLALAGQALAAWLGFWAGAGLLWLLLLGAALLLDGRLRQVSRGMAPPAQASLMVPPAQAGLTLPAQAGLNSSAQAGLNSPAQAGAVPLPGWVGWVWPGLAGIVREGATLRRQLSECETLLEQQAQTQQQEEAQRLEALTAMAQRIEREAGQLIAEMAESASDLGQLTDEVELSTGRVEQQALAASTEADSSAQAADAAAERTAQLAAAVGRISQQISRAAEATRSIAERSRQTREMFNELEGIIEKIGEVSRLIHEIAGQTNLLALNATIEAARAGEAGKGFAVVASEVKTLAGRTAHATTEIADRLGLIQRQAEQVTVSMDSIGTSITELDEVAATVAGAMSEQTTAVNEIARAVSAAANSARQAQEQVAGASREIDDNRMSVGMMHSASGQVLATMDGLQTRLETVVEGAVAAIRHRPAARDGLDLPATLRGVAPSAVPVRVLSLDPWGVSLRVERALPRGTHGLLEVPGLPPVPFRVVGQGTVTRLALLPDAGGWQAALGAFLATLEGRAA